MTRAERSEINSCEAERVQEMIQCSQAQWFSGLSKEKYCKDCESKELCFELLGR